MLLIPFYIFFGVAPSIVWLFFYLRKDKHPEPKRMIIKIFLLGMVSAVFAAVVEIIISTGLKYFYSPEDVSQYPFIAFLLYNFLGIALVEELAKYFVVKKAVLKNAEFDEPVDAQIYMIVSALGFAALENILILLPVEKTLLPQIITITITTSAVRFIGATFLHALASGTLGYFLALSICRADKKLKFISLGILISAFLHGLYNFSIMKVFETQELSFVFIPALILVSSAVFVLYGFNRLYKIKSTCMLK